jgi:hypothetical protein
VRSATPWIVIVAVIGVAVVSGACRRAEERPQDVRVGIGADDSGLTEFTRRAEEYAEWRQRLAGPFGAIDQTKSPNEITAREVAIGHTIRKERASAKAGDIFTPNAAPIIKDRIKAIYKSSPQVRDTRQDAEVEVPDFVPEVNMVYPPTFPLGTFPPTLLKVLPELPKELEYRIVTHHLILRDVESNTIVDVLPNAIP